MFHPWGKLRELAHIAIIWTRPHSHVSAATDGTSRIWLDPALTQVEKRCALTHELVHIKYGHQGCQPLSVEREVCFETARLLVPVDQLAKHAGWALSIAELAEDLSVTEVVLVDRLLTLNGDQLQRLWPKDQYTA